MKRTLAILAAGLVVAAFVLLNGPDSFEIRSAVAGFFAPADSMKGPRIEFNEETHDFGRFAQNTNVETTFIIKNVGTDTLEIISANASCGCTATVLDVKKIAPGQVSRLKVNFDAHNKAEGPMVKTITIVSNAVNGAQKVLKIQGTIFKSNTAHAGEAMSIQKVFEGSCASCHVDKGKGELGAKLYEADCAICHGNAADHKPGPDIASDAMMNHDEKSWTTIIRDGIPNTNMPGFHTKVKGPLNDEEIASIVDYLKAFKKNLAREKSMKSLEGATGSK
jgi:mono/diheme cytochrome c family protein